MYLRIKYWIFTLRFAITSVHLLQCISITFPFMKELKETRAQQEATFRKTTAPRMCVVTELMRQAAGLWNLFRKGPLMGYSLWNTNGSSPRCSKWCKSGLIVQLLLFVSVFSFFFLFLKNSHRIFVRACAHVFVCLWLC